MIFNSNASLYKSFGLWILLQNWSGMEFSLYFWSTKIVVVESNFIPVCYFDSTKTIPNSDSAVFTPTNFDSTEILLLSYWLILIILHIMASNLIWCLIPGMEENINNYKQLYWQCSQKLNTCLAGCRDCECLLSISYLAFGSRCSSNIMWQVRYLVNNIYNIHTHTHKTIYLNITS